MRWHTVLHTVAAVGAVMHVRGGGEGVFFVLVWSSVTFGHDGGAGGAAGGSHCVSDAAVRSAHRHLRVCDTRLPATSYSFISKQRPGGVVCAADRTWGGKREVKSRT